MKVMQKYTTDSLNFFLNRQQLWFMDTNISLEFCKFISTACAEGVGTAPRLFKQRNSHVVDVGCSAPAQRRHVDLDHHIQAPLWL